jgi:CDP-diacylglycerol--glycerol-3-phosphate 3-phosphatidyltransferase
MTIEQPVRAVRPSLSDLMRLWFKWILDPVAGFLLRLGLAPNTITLAGLAGNFIAALYLASGRFLPGGLLVLAMGPVDALDGTMARLRGERSDFGGFVDSVSDRYSELFILGGLLTHYLTVGDLLGAGLAFGAAAGSVLVSYVKARAEGLGFEARGGILTRFERYLVLVPALLLGFDHIGLGIITVLANLTALQRIWIVRGQARRR